MAAPSYISDDTPNAPATTLAHFDLLVPGLVNTGRVFPRLPPATLVQLALARGEGELTSSGALVAMTGERTGRSPKDRFIVREAMSSEDIWWGPVNHPMEASAFNRLLDKTLGYMQGRDVFVTDAWACADPHYRLPV